MFDDLLAGGLDVIRGFAGKPISYHRDGASPVEGIVAVKGTSRFTLKQFDGTSVVVITHDFMFAVEELVIDGEAAVPQVNDRIVEVKNETEFVYQVLDIEGVPCVAYADPGRTEFRVHTELIS